MQIPIVIEPVANVGFRARAVEAAELTAEGATREEALANLGVKVEELVKKGATLTQLEIPTPSHPIARFAGIFKDDPDFTEVLDVIAENRRAMDADSSIP